MLDEKDLTTEENSYFESEGEEPIKEEVVEPEHEENESQEESTEDDKRQKMVPHGALHEERKKRQEIQAQLEQERIKQARMEERLQILAQAVQKTPQEPTIPAFEEDPATHLKMSLEQERQSRERMEKFQREQQEAQKRQQEHVTFVSAYQAKAAEFAATNTDFKDAYKHTIDSRIAEYKTMGYTHDEAVKATVSDERMIAENAMRRGINPAEVIYNLAKQRGFKAVQPQQGTNLETLARGVSASKSIGGMAGKTQAGKLSLEALASMSDEDFREATKGDNLRKFFA